MKKLILLLFPIILFSKINIIGEKYSIEKPIKSWLELKNQNMVKQEYDYSCGSATLATILKFYYNIKVDEKTILDSILKSKGLSFKNKKKIEDSKMSLSFYDLSTYANTLGFKAIGVSLDLNSLKKLQVPVVLFVKIRKDEHFTVFKAIDDNYVYLADPSFGNIKISITKFEEMFYQREDLKYPGKILAIIPKNKQLEINKNFLKNVNYTTSVYNIIKSNINK